MNAVAPGYIVTEMTTWQTSDRSAGPTGFCTGAFKTLADFDYATAGWVEWCNNRRLHSALGMIAAIEHENAYYQALNREPEPVWQRQRTWGGSIHPLWAPSKGYP